MGPTPSSLVCFPKKCILVGLSFNLSLSVFFAEIPHLKRNICGNIVTFCRSSFQGTLGTEVCVCIQDTVGTQDAAGRHAKCWDPGIPDPFYF